MNSTYSITQKIIQAIERKPLGQPSVETCCLCGGNQTIENFHPRKKIFSGNFTDYSELKRPDSKLICDFCVLCLSSEFLPSPKGKRCGLRLYSFLTMNGQFRIIDLKEKEKILFDEKLLPPFILVLSSTGQKHISFKARESTSAAAFWVCTDFANVWFEREIWRPVYELANHFYQNKVTREELRTGNIPPWKFNKYNLNPADASQLKKHLQDLPYQLIITVLTKKETMS